MKLEPSTDAPFVTRKLVHACESMFNNMINIANNKDFNWQDFLATQRLYNNSVKIDIYDQLKFNWDEFINLLWHTRLKYERYDIKFSWEPLKN